jgi:membrane-associated phospholipid phosphatase
VFETAWALTIALTVQTAGGVPQSSPPATSSTLQAATWTDDRPITRFFPNLLHDVIAVPSVNTAMVLGAGGAAAGALHSVDDEFAARSADLDRSSYAELGGFLGDGWVQVGAAFGAYGVGKLAHKPQVIHVGGDLIRAQALNGLITASLKVAVDRTRPDGGHWAFPSGHTSATFASASTLHAHYGWRVGVPAYAVAGFVAWTRARDGKHWLSDVAFGAAIGVVAGRTVASKHGKPSRVTITPAPTKGGSMVTITIQGRGQRAKGRGQ